MLGVSSVVLRVFEGVWRRAEGVQPCVVASAAVRASQVAPGDTSLIFDLSGYNALAKKNEETVKPGKKGHAGLPYGRHGCFDSL